MAPAGHHRCPRYVRGATGTVERVNGGWPPPAEEAAPEAVYRVRFEMRDLWGADAEPGVLLIDLWERYLAPEANTTGVDQ
jgi:nitrile hydratase subunit beta